MNLINIKNTFVMLTGLLLLVLQFTAHADVTFVHTDHLGTPVAYSDAQGNVIGEESTTPFGESLNAPTSDDLPAFTGHVRDGSTGLVYMQARYYDPVVGRFMSTDPVGFESGGVDYFNRYSYVSNNPLGKIDPTGMASEDADEYAEPKGISDEVEVQEDLQDNITVTENEDGSISVDIKISIGTDNESFTEDQLDEIAETMETDLTKTLETEDGVQIHVTASVEAVTSKPDITIRRSIKNYVSEGNRQLMMLSTKNGVNARRPHTPTHELLHSFGMHHQSNSTNSMRSYSADRSVTAADMDRLATAYNR